MLGSLVVVNFAWQLYVYGPIGVGVPVGGPVPVALEISEKKKKGMALTSA